MRKKVRTPSWFLILILALVPLISWSQVQRMGIPVGIHRLGPQGSTKVSTYCMDYTRPAPTANSKYKYVLTPGKNVKVTLGNRTISLQEALNQNLIGIEGASISLYELMGRLEDPVYWNRLSDTERGQLGSAVEEWRNMSESEKQELESLMAPLLSEMGDYTALRFVNKTAEQVTIEFSDNVILGEQYEKIVDLNPSVIVPVDDVAKQEAVQKEIWHKNNKERQRMLKYLGYYEGELDGLIGPKSKKAISDFQADRNLNADGTLNQDTEAALIVAYNEKRIENLNLRNEHLLVVTVENTENLEFHYVVYAGKSEPIYTGNRISDMVSAINTLLTHGTGSRTIYLDMKDFLPDKIEAFATSCRIQQRQINPHITIQSFPRYEGSTESQDLFFSPGVRFVRNSLTEVEVVNVGKHKGEYQFSAQFTRENYQATVSVFARAKEVLMGFIQKLKSYFSTSDYQDISLAELFNRIRADLKTLHNLTEDELIIEFKDQFGGIQVVIIVSRMTEDKT